MKKKKGYYAEYPKRSFLIYPTKYNELFVVLPICFVMFFLKDGGWIYSIIVLAMWFMIAIFWTKTIWIQDCNRKGNYKLYYDGEWINKPSDDFHEDPRTHKADELHYLYNSKTKRWESHDELIERYMKTIKETDDPQVKKIAEIALKKIEECYDDNMKRGM